MLTPKLNKIPDLTLEVGSTRLRFADADEIWHVPDTDGEFPEFDNRTSIYWDDPGFEWAYQQTVPLRLWERVASLSGLVVNDGMSDLTLTPAFDTYKTSYTTQVANDIDQITVTPTTSASPVTFVYLDENGTQIPDADTATTGWQVGLDLGDNTIKVNGIVGTNTMTYTVAVYREAGVSSGQPPPSEVTLVSNTDPVTHEDEDFAWQPGGPMSEDHLIRTQAFTTGRHAAVINSIGLKFNGFPGGTNPEAELTATLNDDGPFNGPRAGVELCTLGSPARSGRFITYQASGCPQLKPNTTYRFVLSWQNNVGDKRVVVDRTSGPDEDASSTAGWTIADSRHLYYWDLNNNTRYWRTDTGFSLIIEINGYEIESTLSVPLRPTNPIAFGRNAGEADFSWDPPASDGGSEISGYTALYQPTGGKPNGQDAGQAPFSTRSVGGDDTRSIGKRSTGNIGNTRDDDTPEGGTVETTDTSIVITGLIDGVEYELRVIAHNEVGSSPPSDPVTVTPGDTTVPLEAEFPSSAFSSRSHSGADDSPQVVVAFSRPVASFTASTPSVSVGGGSVTGVQAHEEQGLENAWVFFLDPVGTDAIEFSLAPDQPCDSGGICAGDGAMLSVVPVAHTIPGPVTSNTPATGPLAGFTLVNASDQAVVGSLTDGAALTLDDPANGSYGIRVDTETGAEIGSVRLELSGAKTVSQTENYVPYSLYGDDNDGLHGEGLPSGAYTLRATAYSGGNLSGDDLGTLETSFTVTDSPAAVVENTPATGAPAITGTAQVGETLMAVTSGIADADGRINATFSYQWLADGADIAGATGGSYTLVDADAGKAIKVRVSFRDDEGNAESLTSEPTVEVAAEPTEPTDPPPKPTNLTARVSADGSITLSWDAPDDDSITGYRILRRRPTQGEDTLMVYVDDTGSTATTYTDTNVTAGIKHVYRVQAINSAGVGPRSNYVNPTP